MNPTNAVLEARVAAMEGGIGALAVASGMSAIAYTEAGDNIVSASTLYGGTYDLFAHTFPQMGIKVRFARFKRFNEPDVSYHGVVYTEALGAATYIGRARVVPLRNMGRP